MRKECLENEAFIGYIFELFFTVYPSFVGYAKLQHGFYEYLLRVNIALNVFQDTTSTI